MKVMLRDRDRASMYFVGPYHWTYENCIHEVDTKLLTNEQIGQLIYGYQCGILDMQDATLLSQAIDGDGEDKGKSYYQGGRAPVLDSGKPIEIKKMPDNVQKMLVQLLKKRIPRFSS